MADRAEIREQLKGTHDIARAAELLLDEGNITYDNSEIGSAQGTVGTMPAGEGYKATRANCFEFVQMCNEISCCRPTYRWGNRLHYLIDPSNMREWDGTSEIPRGSVIVEVNPTRGEGQDKLFHTGISVGDGKIISNLDRWGNDVRREPVGEAFQTAPHTIYYGPYPGCPCSAEERRQSWLHLQEEPLAVGKQWLRMNWLGGMALAALGAVGLIIGGIFLLSNSLREVPPPPAESAPVAAPPVELGPPEDVAAESPVFLGTVTWDGQSYFTADCSSGRRYVGVRAEEIAFVVPDPLGDRLYSDPTQTAQFFPDYVDLQCIGTTLIRSGIVVNLVARGDFRCGATPPDRRIVCTDDVLREPSPLVFVGAETAGDIPLQGHEGNRIIYSAVFDADGDPANNYRPQQPFLNDFFQGTDRWYELVYNPRPGEWSLTVSDARTGRRVPAASKAQAVLWRNTVFFFIPASELPAEKPGFRVTAFVTDGSFRAEKSGGDVAPGPPNDPWRLFELPELGQ